MTLPLGLPLPMLLYWISVLLIAGAVLLRVSGALRRAASWSERVFRARRRLDTIPTETEHEPLEDARERGLDAIARQFSILRRLVYPGILGVTVLALALPLLPRVPATALSLIVGALTVVVGMAIKPMAENAFAGLVLSTSRTINIGDTVEVDKQYGTVEDIRVTHTTVKLWDWKRYVIPNSTMLQSKVHNFSLVDRYQWAYVEFWLEYGVDIAEVEALVRDAARASTYFLGHREEGIEDATVWVMDLQPHAMKCWAAAWAATPWDAWGLKNDLRTALARGLTGRGIRTHQHEVSVGAPAVS